MSWALASREKRKKRKKIHKVKLEKQKRGNLIVTHFAV